MNHIVTASLTVALIFAAAPARADKLDFAQLTCSDFLALSKDEVSTTLIWLEGFYAAGAGAPVLDTDKLGADASKLVQYCAQHPDSTFLNAAAVVNGKGR